MHKGKKQQQQQKIISPFQNKFSGSVVELLLKNNKNPLSHATVEQWNRIFAKLTVF